jgi:hypothetical protein
MKEAFAHPFTLAADLLENGTRVSDVKFIGVERFGNIGILEYILELINSIL